MDIFLAPMVLFHAFPPLAVGVAGLFGLAYRKKRRAVVLWAAGCWVVYGVYEMWMRWVWEPTVVAPIRVDLLVIAPVLYGVTGMGLWRILKR